MGAYTYLAADTLTGTFKGDEMPLTNVSYSVAVNDAAPMTADLPVDAIEGTVDFLEPQRTAIYVDRGGTLPFAGILWDWPTYDPAERVLQLSFLDFLSYLDHLMITQDLFYNTIDQLAIARSIIDYGMNKGGSNLGLAYTGATTSGVTRTRAYKAADAAFIGARLRELAAVDNGFDFRFTARWENGYPRRVVDFGYPTLGRTFAESGVVFDLDADTTSWKPTKTGSTGASTIYAVGSVPDGSPGGTAPAMYTADDPSVRAGGYPRLEMPKTFDEIYDPTSVQAHTKGLLAVSKRPQMTLSITLMNGSGPDLGDFYPGDEVQAVVAAGDGLFRKGATLTGNVTTLQVQPDDQNGDTMTVGLAVSLVEQNA